MVSKDFLKSIRPSGALSGDVVAYSKSDRYVVHRVMRVTPTHYIIRGDNCPCEESGKSGTSLLLL